LRQRIDELHTSDHMAGQGQKLGIEHGDGPGGPGVVALMAEDGERMSVCVIHMCTRQKLGRMMVFTVYRDLIGNNMYLRVTMHDPVSSKDSHLTLLHYTTQRLLSMMRINRDMIDDNQLNGTEDDRKQRTQLRAELGKLIVDHCYLQRIGDREGSFEEIDQLELPDDEDVEYELRMRDIMDTAKSTDLSIKQRLLRTVDDIASVPEDDKTRPRQLPPLVVAKMPQAITDHPKQGPKTLLDISEEHLLHKAEKVVHGRRVFIAFYGETSKQDMISYSHNIRIAVADVQSLDVLAVQDFHEDTLEPLCARRGKRHLLSATRELELVQELCDILALQHVGQEITGITFAGFDE